LLVAATNVTLPLWVLVAQIVVPWAGIAVTLWLGLRDLRMKAKAEAVEADVKLLQTFSTLAPLAGARGEAFFSDTVARKLVEDWSGAGEHLDLRPAVANAPIAASQQAAVMAAIAELAQEHKLLRTPAKAMLRGLREDANSGPEFVQDAYREALQRVDALMK
jgi:hypothetical protein